MVDFEFFFTGVQRQLAAEGGGAGGAGPNRSPGAALGRGKNALNRTTPHPANSNTSNTSVIRVY